MRGINQEKKLDDGNEARYKVKRKKSQVSHTFGSAFQ